MKILSTFMLSLLLVLSLPYSLAPDIGLKLGPQRSDFDSGGIDMSRFKAGLFYSIKINNKISFQPEIYFSQMGINYLDVYYPKGHPSDPSKLIWQYTDKLSYIELPLLLKYSTKLKGDLNPVFFGGGYTAFRVSRNLSFGRQDESLGRGSGIDWTTTCEDLFYMETYSDYEKENSPRPMTGEDVYQSHANVDAGIILGLGLEHGRGKTRMTIDMRFNIGLTDMYKDSTLNLKKRNNAMSFLLGLSF